MGHQMGFHLIRSHPPHAQCEVKAKAGGDNTLWPPLELCYQQSVATFCWTWQEQNILLGIISFSLAQGGINVVARDGLTEDME